MTVVVNQHIPGLNLLTVTLESALSSFILLDDWGWNIDEQEYHYYCAGSTWTDMKKAKFCVLTSV